jgi:hypothetical protein
MTTNTTKQQLAELEAQLEAKDREVSRLYSMLGHAGVTVYGQPDTYPSQSEMDALLRICLAAYPRLADRVPFDELDQKLPGFRRSFALSFWAACYCFGRREKVDGQQYMYAWRRIAEDWLKGQAYSAELHAGAFAGAVIAHGFSYTHPHHPQNFSMSAGLTLGAGDGRAYQPKLWQQILETGRVPEPIEITMPVQFVPMRGEPVVVGNRTQLPSGRWW